MKKVLIVFTAGHLPYSPTTLNLYDSLVPFFDVSIAAFEPHADFKAEQINDRKIKYLIPDVSIFDKLFFKMIGQKIALRLRKGPIIKLLNKKDIVLINEIKKFAGEIIAIDYYALWCVKMAKKRAHFVSLEIYEKDIFGVPFVIYAKDLFKHLIDANIIKSVVIQTEDRYRFLFADKQLPTFFIQNAPFDIDGDIDFNAREKNNLLFCGSAMPGFGILSCLEFIRDFPEYKLTVKGAILEHIKTVIADNFSDLIECGRLVLHNDYLNATELNKFISTFRIGFVFYDFFRFEYINTFNYKTAPSGKLFQYYNAGIPVVGNNIPGLTIISDKGTGRLVNFLGSRQIKKRLTRLNKTILIRRIGRKNNLLNTILKKTCCRSSNF